MAGYRPKSLDELNNLYDKAISAENEIKKGSSLLKSEVLDSAFETSEGKSAPSSVRPNHPKEISNDVDNFIKQFSEKTDFTARPISGEQQRKRPAPLSELKPKEEQSSQNAAPVHEAPAKVQKPNSQKEENLSGLMNDYAKIMSGDYDDEEDEDETFSPRKNIFKSRRTEKKGKKKTAKDIISENELPPSNSFSKVPEVEPEIPPRVRHEQKISAPAENEASKPKDEPSFEKKSEAFALNEKAKESIKNEIAEPKKEENEPEKIEPSLFENDESSPAPSFENETPYEPEQENEPYDGSLDVPFERGEDEDNFEFGDIAPSKRSKASVFAKVLLIVILVLTLLSTALTGVCVFTVNSERSLAGYMFFSATNSYEDAEVKSNDFVICKKSSSIDDGQKVIFINRDLRSFSFGVKNGEKTDKSGNEYYTVSSASIEKSDVLGVIVKTVPSLGKTVRTIVDNFLFILLGLVALAIIVTLILCLAFRGEKKVRYDLDDDDYYDDFEGEEDESRETDGHNEEAEEEYDNDSLFSGIE